MIRPGAVVFDAYGTLFDVHSVAQLAERLFPAHGMTISSTWRDKQIEYTRLISLSDPSPAGSRFYQSFWSLTRAALEYALEKLKLSFRDSDVEVLMGAYAQLQAFPECRGVLETLARKGLPMAILSNGSPEMLSSAVESAGLAPYLPHLLSVDSVRQFKTSPLAYGLAIRTLGLPASNILFVSSNAWDVMGASWYGYTTYWVNRAGLPFETIGLRPENHGSDLTGILPLVCG